MRHELFGALNAISMTAGLLAERARKGKIDAGELGQLAGRLARQIERSTRIVDQYLDLVGPSEEPDGHAATVAELERALAEQDVSVTLTGVGSEEHNEPLGIGLRELRWTLDRVLRYAVGQGLGGTVQASVKVSHDDGVAAVEIAHASGPLTVDDLHVFERGNRNDLLLDLAVARRVLTDVGGEMAPREGGFLIRIPLADE